MHNNVLLSEWHPCAAKMPKTYVTSPHLSVLSRVRKSGRCLTHVYRMPIPQSSFTQRFLSTPFFSKKTDQNDDKTVVLLYNLSYVEYKRFHVLITVSSQSYCSL